MATETAPTTKPTSAGQIDPAAIGLATGQGGAQTLILGLVSNIYTPDPKPGEQPIAMVTLDCWGGQNRLNLDATSPEFRELRSKYQGGGKVWCFCSQPVQYVSNKYMTGYKTQGMGHIISLT